MPTSLHRKPIDPRGIRAAHKKCQSLHSILSRSDSQLSKLSCVDSSASVLRTVFCGDDKTKGELLHGPGMRWVMLATASFLTQRGFGYVFCTCHLSTVMRLGAEVEQAKHGASRCTSRFDRPVFPVDMVSFQAHISDASVADWVFRQQREDRPRDVVWN